MDTSDFLMLSANELKSLIAQEERFELSYNIKIHYPDVVPNTSLNEVIFVTICGKKDNVSKAKVSLQKLLSSKKQEMSNEEDKSLSSEKLEICNEENIPLSSKNQELRSETNIPLSKKHEICNEENIPLVILSDTDSDNEVEIVSLKRKRSVSLMNDNVRVTCPHFEKFSNEQKKKKVNNKKVQKQNSKNPVLPNFIPIRLDRRRKKKGKSKEMSSQLIPVSSSQLSTKVTPLSTELAISKRIVSDPTRLRPVAIDASNIARAHGKPTNTFSCKGILLSVKYFVERNHSCVKAFVPLNKRGKWTNNHIEITDQDLLDKMHSSGHLVYTPTRYVPGQRKYICCYDDRFIVEYAAATGGVILSNDNFRDILSESDEFKKTIEERLLMFCFAGDVLMIPKDPLGRDGPTLDEFLSFPEVKESVPSEEKTVDMDESVMIIEDDLPVTSVKQSVSTIQRVL